MLTADGEFKPLSDGGVPNELSDSGAPNELSEGSGLRALTDVGGLRALIENGALKTIIEDSELRQKFELLAGIIKDTGSAACAFSSGVDSALLLFISAAVLGEKACAVTVRSGMMSGAENWEAVEFCRRYGIRQMLIDIDETEIEGFCDNPPDRCYICKKALFTRIIDAARREGFETVLEGTNLDDTADYRPGMRAVQELGVKSPLKEAGMSKSDIRELSRLFGLSTWNKPSAACLASRIAYGERISRTKLRMAEEAEELLHSLGYIQCRVRIHGDKNMIARIELPETEIAGFLAGAEKSEVYTRLRSLGFSYVTADLKGYRTGSMNEVIQMP